MIEVPIPITPGYPLAKYLLPLTMFLCFADLQDLFIKGGMLSPGDKAVILMKWKLRVPFSVFRFLMALNQKTKKEVTMLVGVINYDTKDKVSAIPQ